MSDTKMSLYVVKGDDEQWFDDPDAILNALAEAGVLYEEETGPYYDTEGVMESPQIVRYVSPWKSAE